MKAVTRGRNTYLTNVFDIKCLSDCTNDAQKKIKRPFICYSKRREMNASDPDHGDGSELKVEESGHRGPQTCSAASFVVLFNDIPLFTPIRFNNELNGMKR